MVFKLGVENIFIISEGFMYHMALELAFGKINEGDMVVMLEG